MRASVACVVATLSVLFSSWTQAPSVAAEAGAEAGRTGDEIVVCGRFFHTTAPVVLWMDAGGYDAYRVERRFGPLEQSSWDASFKEAPILGTPNRYSTRDDGFSPEMRERVRGGGWDLPTLQDVVDQFVLHYDVCGCSQTCFRVLQDQRGLSVQFMLDVDGTIYQTLDLKERARHATISNNRSIGIEIAHIGAYRRGDTTATDRWYETGDDGVRLRPPKPWSELGVRTKDFAGRPDRPEPICANIQGGELCQYDFTPEQYDSLIKLTATLCQVFPKLKCDYPRDADGKLIPRKLDDEAWRAYQGVLGHYHVQLNKTDPGPALNWDKVIDGARALID
jgi:N-acetylmuramoyl-L-alanine amidase